MFFYMHFYFMSYELPVWVMSEFLFNFKDVSCVVHTQKKGHTCLLPSTRVNVHSCDWNPQFYIRESHIPSMVWVCTLHIQHTLTTPNIFQYLRFDFLNAIYLQLLPPTFVNQHVCWFPTQIQHHGVWNPTIIFVNPNVLCPTYVCSIQDDRCQNKQFQDGSMTGKFLKRLLSNDPTLNRKVTKWHNPHDAYQET